MTKIADTYINALLADAAYVNLLNEPLNGSGNQDLLGNRMTPTLAAYIATNFEVASIINNSDIPLIGSGFDATVWRGKAGGDYAGQVFVSMRGTEPDVLNGQGADLLADGDLAFNSGARSQIIDMVNWWLRESTPTLTDADTPRYLWRRGHRHPRFVGKFGLDTAQMRWRTVAEIMHGSQSANNEAIDTRRKAA